MLAVISLISTACQYMLRMLAVISLTQHSVSIHAPYACGHFFNKHSMSIHAPYACRHFFNRAQHVNTCSVRLQSTSFAKRSMSIHVPYACSQFLLPSAACLHMLRTLAVNFFCQAQHVYTTCSVRLQSCLLPKTACLYMPRTTVSYHVLYSWFLRQHARNIRGHGPRSHSGLLLMNQWIHTISFTQHNWSHYHTSLINITNNIGQHHHIPFSNITHRPSTANNGQHQTTYQFNTDHYRPTMAKYNQLRSTLVKIHIQWTKSQQEHPLYQYAIYEIILVTLE